MNPFSDKCRRILLLDVSGNLTLQDVNTHAVMTSAVIITIIIRIYCDSLIRLAIILVRKFLVIDPNNRFVFQKEPWKSAYLFSTEKFLLSMFDCEDCQLVLFLLLLSIHLQSPMSSARSIDFHSVYCYQSNIQSEKNIRWE